MVHPNTISLAVYWFFKIGFILITLLFVGFGVLLIRQVRLMSDTVKDPMNEKIVVVSWLYFLLTLATLGYFIFLF